MPAYPELRGPLRERLHGAKFYCPLRGQIAGHVLRQFLEPLALSAEASFRVTKQQQAARTPKRNSVTYAVGDDGGSAGFRWYGDILIATKVGGEDQTLSLAG